MKPTCKTKPTAGPTLAIAICVLAGGLGSRMGRDKARLRFGRHSLLRHVRAMAEAMGQPVRIIRRDLMPRCGPLGGIYTALKTSRADAELFLACDMPFVSPALLARLLKRVGAGNHAVFAAVDGLAGFPFLLRVSTLPVVERQIAAKQFSIQALAEKLRAGLIRIPPRQKLELFNINTPEEWQAARRMRLAGFPRQLS